MANGEKCDGTVTGGSKVHKDDHTMDTTNTEE